MKIQVIRIFAMLTLQLLFYFENLMTFSRNFTDVCEMSKFVENSIAEKMQKVVNIP